MRLVWRTENDGNGDVKVLIPQIWEDAKSFWSDDMKKQGGVWHDIPISLEEEGDNPSVADGADLIDPEEY